MRGGRLRIEFEKMSEGEKMRGKKRRGREEINGDLIGEYKLKYKT